MIIKLHRIVHVLAPTANSPLRFEAISGDPSSLGKTEIFRCSEDIYNAVLGSRSEDGNVTRPGLRGLHRHHALVHLRQVEVSGKKKQNEVYAVDLIPTKFFDGNSGSVEAREARKSGMVVVYNPEHLGFRVDVPYLGLSYRDMFTMLGELRQKIVAEENKAQFFTLSNGDKATRVDETTWRVSNPKPFVDRGF